MNRMSEDQLANLAEQFDRSMRLSSELFGKHSFRKSLKERKSHVARTVLNISLFDALSVSFAQGSFDKTDHPAIANRIASLLQDYDFDEAITRSTNSTIPVKTRFRMAERTLAEFVR